MPIISDVRPLLFVLGNLFHTGCAQYKGLSIYLGYPHYPAELKKYALQELLWLFQLQEAKESSIGSRHLSFLFQQHSLFVELSGLDLLLILAEDSCLKSLVVEIFEVIFQSTA
jgi:hypothetical protein